MDVILKLQITNTNNFVDPETVEEQFGGWVNYLQWTLSPDGGDWSIHDWIEDNSQIQVMEVWQ